MEMPQSNKNSAQPVSMPVHPRSAQRSLVKVESGIKGPLPPSWAPPIYSVSLLTKLRCALAGNNSFACDSCSLVPRSHLPNAKTRRKKKSEKTRQGLYNVGFIGIENKDVLRPRLNENGPTLFKNSLKTSAPAHIR